MEKQLTLDYKIVKACAFTGHRILEKDFSLNELKKQIKNVVENGVEIFYNGMAQGFDLISAEVVLSMKKKNPQIKLIACVPFYGQERNFSEEDKERYVKILKKADEVVYLSDTYYKGCMLVRDRYMADRGDMIITYCKKQTGGTAYTVKYFQKKYPEKEIIFL